MIAVRLLSDAGVVREQVFRELPVLIGRGPECDFVILDATVSRRHARVYADDTGTLRVEDLGSDHGLVTDEVRVPGAALAPGSLSRYRLGAAEVELVVPSLDDTAEFKPAPPMARGSALRAAGWCAAGLLAIVARALCDPSFWSPWQQERATMLSSLVLGAAVALPVFAFVLVGLLRIVGRRVPVTLALRAFALVAWAGVLVGALDALAYYVLPKQLLGWLQALLASALPILFLPYLASLGRTGPNGRFRAGWAAAIAALIVASGLASQLSARQKGTPSVDFDVQVPILGRSGPAKNLEPFLDGMLDDFETAQQNAEKERRESAEAGG